MFFEEVFVFTAITLNLIQNSFKLILIEILLSGIGFSSAALLIIFGNKTKNCLMRHAEKLPGSDLLLPLDGNIRTGDLIGAMMKKSIIPLFVTDHKRN